MLKKLSLHSLVLFIGIIGEMTASFWNNVPAIASPSPNSEVKTAFDSDFASPVLCTTFTPLNNTVEANDSFSSFPVATSNCAKDLTGVESARDLTQTTPDTPTDFEEEIVPAVIENPISKPKNAWHFKLQPYVTVPLTTYGSATVRGRSVDYHLSLGETLQNLRVTASGRFEGWKGRWGFIFDGYYASLQGIADFQRTTERIPNTINALNYLLSRDVNTQAQNLATLLGQDVERLERIEALRESQPVQTLRQTVETFQESITEDAQILRDLAQDLEDIQAAIEQEESRLQARNFDLQQREPLRLSEIELRDIITLNNQNRPDISPQRLEATLKRLDRLDLQQQRQDENRNIVREVEQEISNLRAVDERIETALMRLESLESLQQRLNETRDVLAEINQEVNRLRAIADSPELQEIEAKIQNAQVILEEDIQALNQIRDFAENRSPQVFDANVNTDLQFNQGIYDFALSYHIGELPLTELPETPSNRAYPLLWFQPIAGVRLNNINVTIEETINLSLTSTLVDFQGTFQQTFEGGRTWFEPLLGGKLGLQISDPITFWVRGDVSGFGLAGETDLSWNVFFGVDWWVRRHLSLQFAYHFYHINYQIGSGNNAFGLEQNLNGPYLSATFHF